MDFHLVAAGNAGGREDLAAQGSSRLRGRAYVPIRASRKSVSKYDRVIGRMDVG